MLDTVTGRNKGGYELILINHVLFHLSSEFMVLVEQRSGCETIVLRLSVCVYVCVCVLFM